MERPLTSWKEIATHFNKSVRTVQRWEAQFGLPVRRPDAHDHGIVVAFPSELERWANELLTIRGSNGTGARNGWSLGHDLASQEGEWQGPRNLLDKLQTTLEHSRRLKNNFEQLKITVEQGAVIHDQVIAECRSIRAFLKQSRRRGAGSNHSNHT